jgi:hypothetical protein
MVRLAQLVATFPPVRGLSSDISTSVCLQANVFFFLMRTVHENLAETFMALKHIAIFTSHACYPTVCSTATLSIVSRWAVTLALHVLFAIHAAEAFAVVVSIGNPLWCILLRIWAVTPSLKRRLERWLSGVATFTLNRTATPAS